MSDTDRLLASIVRQEREHAPTDRCTCGRSGLRCRANRYFNGNDAYCCDQCTHTEGTP